MKVQKIIQALSRMLIVFCTFSSTQAVAQARVHDPCKFFYGFWLNHQPMPAGRTGMASNVIDNKIYFTGGTDLTGDNPEKNGVVWKYDPVKEIWDTSLTPLPLPRTLLGDYSCVLENRIYVIGGREKYDKDTVFSARVDLYDPASDSWQSRNNLPVPLTGLGACSLNGQVFVTGGISNNCLSEKSVYSYDPAMDSWNRVADMLSPRYNHIAVAVDGKLYAIGGINNNSSLAALKSAEVYNPVTDSWSPLAPVPTQICEMASCVVGNEIYLLGGKKSLRAGILPCMMKYNPSVDSWLTIDEIPGRLYQATASVFSRNIYLFGGSGARESGIDRVWTYQLSDVILEKYLPDQDVHEESLKIDLSQYFKHAEGGRIEYSVCDVSDATVVSTSINENLLIIEGISEGEVQINLLAESGDNKAGDDFFVRNFYTGNSATLIDIPLFMMYPNPAGNEINFRTRNLGAYMLTISTMNGQIVMNQMITEPIFRLNISPLPGGVYIIHAQNESFIRIEKLIKS